MTAVTRRLFPHAAHSCWLLFAAHCMFIPGCGRGIEKVPVIGTVTVGGKKPDGGEIRFIPIENTPGPMSAGLIENGRFQIDARGGVPVGKHRVEVAACRKTGRKILAPFGIDKIDEISLIVPVEYTTEQSPLTVQIAGDTADSLEIVIP